MTPQIQFEPSRNRQRLKRMPHSSEAERKGLFALGRFLEVQEERQPRPFLNTALGKLPPELRVMIYQHLLVIFRLEADSDHNTENVNRSSTVSQPFIHLKKSGLSILRTCRQLKHEAHRILLTSGIPYFANASELLSFLTCIGSRGRLRLEALRVGALVFPEPFAYRNGSPQSEVVFVDSGNRISRRSAKKHPHTIGALSLLMECESLRTIYMDMKQGEERMLFVMLRDLMRGVHKDLHLLGLHSWCVFRLDVREPSISWPRHFAGMYRTLTSSGKLMGRDALVNNTTKKNGSCSMLASRATRCCTKGAKTARCSVTRKLQSSDEVWRLNL